MKKLFENWRRYLKEFQEPEGFSLITTADVYETLESILEQAKFAYESLLSLHEKFNTISETRIPKSRGRRSLIRLVKLAQEQEWEFWYENNYKVIEEIFSAAGIEDPSILNNLLLVLAATSQGSNPKANVTFAIKGLKNIYLDEYTTEEEFYHTEDPEKKGEYLPDVAANLARISRGEDLRGAKLKPYAKALAGDEEAVAVDRHIFDIFFGSEQGSNIKRTLATKEIIAIAKKLDLKPRQVQAALWAANQIRNKKIPLNYIDTINQNLDVINSLLSEITSIRTGPEEEENETSI